MNFSDLAQANVDFYDEHPAAHAALMVAYGVVAVVVINKLLRRLTKDDYVSDN